MDAYLIMFFFLEKKQKCSNSSDTSIPKTRRSRPWGFGGLPPRKKAKWLV
jgi:hypothetical protein